MLVRKCDDNKKPPDGYIMMQWKTMLIFMVHNLLIIVSESALQYRYKTYWQNNNKLENVEASRTDNATNEQTNNQKWVAIHKKVNNQWFQISYAHFYQCFSYMVEIKKMECRNLLSAVLYGRALIATKYRHFPLNIFGVVVRAFKWTASKKLKSMSTHSSCHFILACNHFACTCEKHIIYVYGVKFTLTKIKWKPIEIKCRDLQSGYKTYRTCNAINWRMNRDRGKGVGFE